MSFVVANDYVVTAKLRRDMKNTGFLDKVSLYFTFNKLTTTLSNRCIVNGYVSLRDLRTTTTFQVAQRHMYANYHKIKRDISIFRHNNKYLQKISKHLSDMGVPQITHMDFIEKAFNAILLVQQEDTALHPIHVSVCEIDYYSDNVIVGEYIPKFTPATRSSIQALVPLSLVGGEEGAQCSECAICLDDFTAALVPDQQQPTATCLPCGHLFHMHCIVQSLNVSHLCPLCRYPMPSTDQSL